MQGVERARAEGGKTGWEGGGGQRRLGFTLFFDSFFISTSLYTLLYFEQHSVSLKIVKSHPRSDEKEVAMRSQYNTV